MHEREYNNFTQKTITEQIHNISSVIDLITTLNPNDHFDKICIRMVCVHHTGSVDIW